MESSSLSQELRLAASTPLVQLDNSILPRSRPEIRLEPTQDPVALNQLLPSTPISDRIAMLDELSQGNRISTSRAGIGSRILALDSRSDAAHEFSPIFRASNLTVLEAQAAQILLEVAATLKPAALMFSGGKDSACIAHIAKKLFTNSSGQINIPFSFFHYDSGDNFEQVLHFRDRVVSELNVPLKIFNVQEAFELGQIQTALDGKGNILALVELINFSQRSNEIRALIGGGRRDEDPVRAKERIFSLREVDGRWRPDQQRPELWNIYNTELTPGQHLRVFPISNWTERTVWEYITQENISLPEIYYSHEREVISRDGGLVAYIPGTTLRSGECVEIRKVRCRSVGDQQTTGFVESLASSPSEVLEEIRNSRYSERAGRAEGAGKATAMEPRKQGGWF